VSDAADVHLREVRFADALQTDERVVAAMAVFERTLVEVGDETAAAAGIAPPLVSVKIRVQFRRELRGLSVRASVDRGGG
jgi:hypothetical protein